MDETISVAHSLTLVEDESTPDTKAPLMHKLPTEIRLQIFGHVLRSRYPLVRIESESDVESGSDCDREDDTYLLTEDGREKYDATTINNSLFSVCRKISLEAQEAFCEVNTLRALWLGAVRGRCFMRVRNLELCEQASVDFFNDVGDTLDRIAKLATRLPKLKSIAIGCDARYRSGALRSIILEQQPKIGLCCLRLGVFELALENDSLLAFDKPKKVPKKVPIYLEYFNLQVLLPEARLEAVQHSLQDFVDLAQPAGPYAEERWSHFTAVRYCARWLRFYEACRIMRDERQPEEIGEDYDLPIVLWVGMDRHNSLLPSDVKLQDLTAEHDTILLE